MRRTSSALALTVLLALAGCGEDEQDEPLEPISDETATASPSGGSSTGKGSQPRGLAGNLDEQHRLASWHLITPDGRRFSGGAAAAPMARLLPAGAPVAFLAETFPRSTDRLYRWVARNRDTLGRRLGEQACSVDPRERNERPTSS